MKRIATVLATGCAALALSFAAGAAGTNEDSNGVPATRSAPGPDAQAQDFGLTNSYFTAIEASSLNPYQTGFNHTRTASGTGIWCSAGSTESRAVAEFYLPHGASLEFLRAWGLDSVADNMTVKMDQLCLPDFAGDQPTETAKGNIVSAGVPGFWSGAVGISGTVDTMSCTYRLTVQFANALGSCPGTSQLAFYKARVQWVRQISPAPAVASFTDVPVGSQFFAEVEALKRSGITGGCTGTTFCPTQAVTRLQMAAFLARALGLQFDTVVDPANP